MKLLRSPGSLPRAAVSFGLAAAGRPRG